ncbi:hypothetical protein AXG89_33995 [Burkholderia sp. PAMC 26561]|nr:hypothetical protein AXG89_33995 [Burkholderia sp. PAMC 26561]
MLFGRQGLAGRQDKAAAQCCADSRPVGGREAASAPLSLRVTKHRLMAAGLDISMKAASVQLIS